MIDHGEDVSDVRHHCGGHAGAPAWVTACVGAVDRWEARRYPRQSSIALENQGLALTRVD